MNKRGSGGRDDDHDKKPDDGHKTGPDEMMVKIIEQEICCYY